MSLPVDLTETFSLHKGEKFRGRKPKFKAKENKI
jgi:hypothetical protein